MTETTVIPGSNSSVIPGSNSSVIPGLTGNLKNRAARKGRPEFVSITC